MIHNIRREIVRAVVRKSDQCFERIELRADGGPQVRTVRVSMLTDYFVIRCFVGVTVEVGAAFEIWNVSQTFQPSGRFSAANSLYPLKLR